MSSFYKPNNYTTVSPYLIVDGAGRTIEFLGTSFRCCQIAAISRC